MTCGAAKRKHDEFTENDTLMDGRDEFIPRQNQNQPIRRRTRSTSTSDDDAYDSNILDIPEETPTPCNPPELWHLTLIHGSTSTLSKIPLIKSTYDSTKCRACIRAKMKRQPFEPVLVKATRPLQRLHSDLSGPWPSSRGRSIYAMTLLDEFTDYGWVFTLKNKESRTVALAMGNHIRKIENEVNLRVYNLYTNDRSEYQGTLTSFLTEIGIEYELIVLYIQ